MTQYSGKIIRKTPVVPSQTSASGVWTTADAAAAVKTNTWPVAGVPNPISRSVRLRSSASAYFNRTLTTPTLGTKWTWSGWLKRGTLGAAQTLFGGSSDVNNWGYFGFLSGDTLTFQQADAASVTSTVTTTQLFRDPAAWYHIQVAFDSTQATAANRLKMYVNNVQITAFGTATYLAQNTASRINQAVGHTINRLPYSAANYFDGYLTEVNFIDGQALTPSSFGTTDSLSGAWIPMPYTGTYGTNGFYLNFKDNTSTTTIGYDYSGNSNNWTANNISLTAGTTYDSMVDVPTLWMPYNTAGDVGATVRGNYCVMNPLSVVSPTTIANGNLDVTTGTTGGGGAFSTIAIPSSGKYYFEFLPTSATTVADNIRVGVSNSTVGSYVLYKSDGNKVVDGSTTSYGATFTTNDTIGCAVDVDGGTITFYKNNSSQGSITYATSSGNFFAYTQDGSGTVSVVASFNFGQRPFTYTPPSGYKSLNTFNLSAPTINNGASYMAATLYTGNGTSQSISNSVNGVSFQPDFVWYKSRSAARNNVLFDSVRGIYKKLYSNATDAEASDSQSLTAFNSNGFSVGSDSDSNLNAATFVGWQWKAGGTAVTNTDGTITTTVSASPSSGFSVMTYTGTGIDNKTIGHGLNAVPKFLIWKPRASVTDWMVWHTGLSGYNYDVRLNTTAAQSTGANPLNNTAPSSTVITLRNQGDVNGSGTTIVCYAFAAVAGYSAFGSYTGNGSADGPFVFLGFRPRFVIIRRIDAGNNWHSYTSTIDPSNVVAKTLYPNTSGTEGTENDLDFVSNGMKMRDTGTHTNASGGTYIYAAFAENPFKYSNAR
jgi:hypothetical protein